VLLAAEAGPDWMSGFLSILHADLVAVPIPAATPPALARLVVTFAGVRAWIADRADGELAAALSTLPRLLPADLADPTAAPLPRSSSDPHATAVLVFTSGSTTRPRAVALSHGALGANLRSLLTARQADPDEALLSTLPPAHAYELVAGQLAPLAAGARIVYAGVPLPNRIVEAVRTQAITRMVIVPALFEALVRDVIDGLISQNAVEEACRTLAPGELATRLRGLSPAGASRLRTGIRERLGPSLRIVTLGGAASNSAWADVLAIAGIDLDVGYGLTEAGPVVAIGRASQCPAGSVGQPLPGVQVRINADDEVVVRTDAVMQGYSGDPAATAAAFDGPWLRTGDRGRVDEAGFLFITGRIKEAMVTAAGETIYPDEIEPYYASPLFAEYAVVPAKGADGNDQPTLVVVPASPATDEDVIRRAVGALTAAAPPRLRIHGFTCRTLPLPRTAVGKIRRRVLADDLRPDEVTS
jgi:long-chain acyl-CoA synthetase